MKSRKRPFYKGFRHFSILQNYTATTEKNVRKEDKFHPNKPVGLPWTPKKRSRRACSGTLELLAVFVFKFANDILDRNIDPAVAELFYMLRYFVIKRLGDTSGDTRLRVSVTSE